MSNKKNIIKAISNNQLKKLTTIPTLNEEVLNSILHKMDKGRCYSFSFKSDKSKYIAKAFKTWRVVKICSDSYRVKMKYANTAKFIATHGEGATPEEPNGFHHVKPEDWSEEFSPYLENNHSGRRALQMFFNPSSSKTESFYQVTSPDGEVRNISGSELKALGIMQPSFWNHKSGDRDEPITVYADMFISATCSKW